MTFSIYPGPDSGDPRMKAEMVPPRLAGESEADSEPAPVSPKAVIKAPRTSEGRTMDPGGACGEGPPSPLFPRCFVPNKNSVRTKQ